MSLYNKGTFDDRFYKVVHENNIKKYSNFLVTASSQKSNESNKRKYIIAIMRRSPMEQ